MLKLTDSHMGFLLSDILKSQLLFSGSKPHQSYKFGDQCCSQKQNISWLDATHWGLRGIWTT
jgi:hypothetical protein